MTEYCLYVVDDEPTILNGLKTVLGQIYTVKTFGTASSALDAIEQSTPDMVLLDIGLPDMNGLNVLKKIKAINNDIVVIMVTAYEDINNVITSMKEGAFDYVVKPIQMDTLKTTVHNGLESIRLTKEVRQLQEQYLNDHIPCFIGDSNAIQDVMSFITKVAASPDTPILIQGETGTGKELIASAIHYRSPNFRGPLISVNCAAIPGELIESELFGYEKGAFTGASEQGKTGLIEEAAGGTLFMDEVGDLSSEAQAKLLRFLEDGEFFRVGGTQSVKVKTRLVSATNRNLKEMMEQELFRPDLFYRLGVISVQLPSLRERQGDIIQLAKYFLHEFNSKFSKKFEGFTPDAEQTLLAHPWSGNVRELRNVVERAALVGESETVTSSDLGISNQPATSIPDPKQPYPPLPSSGIDLTTTLENMEKYYLEQALQQAEGNESKAARMLNMNHHTFRYHLKKHK